ncbi:hypothetical protein QWY93_03685 [Echinicola jeungdonensis]|uniref:Uncharacterized protein n=1 Tax=Echinicola jeungdonensis TaxID=709343 RepID=A0ABV5J193_9BACT|nr:hypothetical protein [Echinicola jeungdonensis]MDN3668428.1 hypothetical protein [Echinicola jeungdonensis]
MTFADDILGRLFPKKQKGLEHRENFRLTEQERKEMLKWYYSEEGQKLFSKIYQNYHLKKTGENTTPELYIYRSPYANGLAIEYDFTFSPETFSCLFFAFGQRIVDLGYERVSLDRIIRDQQGGVSIIEKQYFKPKMTRSRIGQTIKQLYGNVTIEKVTVNQEPKILKILATVYADRMYEDAMPFENFIEVLFDQ